VRARLHRSPPIKNLSRYGIAFALAVVSFFAAGCGHARQASADSGSGLTKVVLQADWYPQPEQGGYFTALAKGYYRDEGLDVTITPLGPYLGVEKAMASGDAEFGMSGSDETLEAIANGQPIIAVAATLQDVPQVIMVRKNSAIHSFEDLNGHTVAIKTGAPWWLYLQKKYHLTNVHEVPSMMNVANFVADPDYVQQAFATSEPYFAQKAGVETRLLNAADTGYRPFRVMITTPAFLKRHPEIVGKFVRASLRGWREYLIDPAPAHALIAKMNPALTPDLMQFSWRALRDGNFITGDDRSGAKIGQMDPKRWQEMYTQLLDLKVIERPFDPSTAYTLQFLQKASAGN
jgi:NitT/TauT family transport system substrate-binding protein